MMLLRNGKKIHEKFFENPWWLKYTKEFYVDNLDINTFNRSLYGRFSVDDWLLYALPDYYKTESYIRRKTLKKKNKKCNFTIIHYK